MTTGDEGEGADPAERPMICRNCETEISREARFCSACGASAPTSEAFDSPWMHKRLWKIALPSVGVVVVASVILRCSSTSPVWPAILSAGAVGYGALSCGLIVLFIAARSERIGASRYRDVRDQITHEDDLINHRLSWLITSQAFLFGAFALQYTRSAPTFRVHTPTPEVFTVIPWVAVVSAGLIHTSVAAAIGTIEALRYSFGRSATDAAYHPPVSSSGWTARFGMIAPLYLAPVLIYVWTFLITRGGR